MLLRLQCKQYHYFVCLRDMTASFNFWLSLRVYNHQVKFWLKCCCCCCCCATCTRSSDDSPTLWKRLRTCLKHHIPLHWARTDGALTLYCRFAVSKSDDNIWYHCTHRSWQSRNIRFSTEHFFIELHSAIIYGFLNSASKWQWKISKSYRLSACGATGNDINKMVTRPGDRSRKHFTRYLLGCVALWSVRYKLIRTQLSVAACIWRKAEWD